MSFPRFRTSLASLLGMGAAASAGDIRAASSPTMGWLVILECVKTRRLRHLDSCDQQMGVGDCVLEEPRLVSVRSDRRQLMLGRALRDVTRLRFWVEGSERAPRGRVRLSGPAQKETGTLATTQRKVKGNTTMGPILAIVLCHSVLGSRDRQAERPNRAPDLGKGKQYWLGLMGMARSIDKKRRLIVKPTTSSMT